MEQTLFDGRTIDVDASHFTCPFALSDETELEKLSQFRLLTSASFTGIDLTDVGLEIVCRITTLENLCLQGTRITNDGIKLLRNLTGLRHLRLKDSYQLNNQCIEHLLLLENLVDLAVHEAALPQTCPATGAKLNFQSLWFANTAVQEKQPLTAAEAAKKKPTSIKGGGPTRFEKTSSLFRQSL